MSFIGFWQIADDIDRKHLRGITRRVPPPPPPRQTTGSSLMITSATSSFSSDSQISISKTILKQDKEAQNYLSI